MVAFFVRNKPVVRIISFVLIMALCLSGLSLLSPPADAIVITATTVGVIISFLALCGITFASVDIAQKAATAFADDISSTDSGLWSEIQNITDKVDNGNIDPNDPYDPGNLAISAMTGAAVAKLFNKIKSWFGNDQNDSTVDSYSDKYGEIDGQRFLLSTSGMSQADIFAGLNAIPLGGASDNVYLTVNGTKFLLTFGSVSNNERVYCQVYQYSLSDGVYNRIYNNSVNTTSKLDDRWGLFMRNGNLGVIIMHTSISQGRPVEQFFYPFSPVSDVKEIAVKEKVPYSNKTKYPINNIYKALSDKIKTGESVKIDISELLTELQDTSTENLTINQEQLLVQTDILTSLEDIAASQPSDPFEGVPKPSPMPTIGNIWDFVSDFLEDALIWMKLWVSGFIELPKSLQDTLWAILVVVIVIGVLGVIL